MKLRNLLIFTFVFSIFNFALATQAVKIGSETLFELQHGMGAFSLKERASAIEARINSIAKDRTVDIEKLTIEEFENSSNVMSGDRVIVTLTDRDAKSLSVTRQSLANTIKSNIISGVKEYRAINSWRQYALSVAYVILSTIILLFLLSFISKLFPKALKITQNWSIKNIPSIKISSYELFPSSRIVSIALVAIKFLRIVFIITLLYLYVPIVFSFFPYTSGWADKIFGYVANPLKNIAAVVIEYIPNLFFIAVVYILTSYLLKFLNFIFMEIERGSLKFKGFYPEWASPTYKLVRFLVFAFALVVVFPYLPGSGSPAFQGISVFLGVLLSFGSSSAISNIIGGVVLTYMRPFKVGDRVKIGETTGDVIEKSLLVTRVRTPKNVNITVPNAMVLSSHLINFSSSAADTGLILHSTVTIGYDVDWRQVHELLINSALKVDGILDSPAPFVLQTSLDDFYVSYEINAYTDRPHRMAIMYSEIHRNIQEQFKEAGVEIMSPHFSAHRDGSQVNIPVDSPEKRKFVDAIRVQNN